MKRESQQAGVTLLEMMIVVALVAVLAGLTFPAVSSGVDSLRLNGAAQSIVSYLDSAMNRAERRQQLMEISISPKENSVTLRSTEEGYVKTLALPDGVTIVEVLPEAPLDREGTRNFVLYPGGAVPRIGVRLVNRRGMRRMVSVDPITGVAQIQPDTPK